MYPGYRIHRDTGVTLTDRTVHVQVHNVITYISLLTMIHMITVIVKVDSTSEVDFSLIQDPTFTTTYVETQHKVNAGHQWVINILYSFNLLLTG